MQETVTVSLLQVQTNKLVSSQSHKLTTEQTHVQKAVLSKGCSFQQIPFISRETSQSTSSMLRQKGNLFLDSINTRYKDID